MSEEEFTRYIKTIRQQIEALHKYIVLEPTQQPIAEAMEEIVASLGNLQLCQEEMQTSLEAMEDIQDELLQQNEDLAVELQHYYELFNFAPDAYLLTDAQGIILKANRTAGALFNILPNFLIGKPLANFVAEAERSLFRIKLNQLSQLDSVQEWEIAMCPRGSQPFDATLMVAPNRDTFGSLVSLQISIRDVTKHKQANLQLQSVASQLLPEAAAGETPRSLDGLQVLFVDDEADAREFITTVLEQYGISVTAVNSVAEALEVLERSHPDVIISDIRMPDEDGYTLIRKVKALEAEKGWQIPTAALTAYLAEDRAKALKVGFQSHLHKLAEPAELVAMVAQLAGRG
ncbi:response regulator [Chlorogloeopsis sp. ULAP02]|uniref:response regulator n=1 Tax=Chlorogloeopsis sp. ULAP02 TaxID=3107926 RepID=UPI00313545C9